MNFDFDPQNRLRWLVKIVLLVLIFVVVGLFVMAPALFPPGPKK